MNSEQVIELVLVERQRQIETWGKQNHSLFYWILILQEEIGEVAKAIIDNEPKEPLLKEAVQVAAVAVQMCEWASDVVGWPCSSREVLDLLFKSWKLSPGTPIEAHLPSTAELGMLSMSPGNNLTAYAQHASSYLRKIAFFRCLLIYRLHLEQANAHD